MYLYICFSCSTYVPVVDGAYTCFEPHHQSYRLVFSDSTERLFHASKLYDNFFD